MTRRLEAGARELGLSRRATGPCRAGRPGTATACCVVVVVVGSRRRRGRRSARPRPRRRRRARAARAAPTASASASAAHGRRAAAAPRAWRDGASRSQTRVPRRRLHARLLRAAPARCTRVICSVRGESATPRRARSRSADHLLGRLVAVAGVLRERAQHDLLERRRRSPGAYTLGGTGSSLRCFIAIATAESPSNGTRPVSISYSTMPTRVEVGGRPDDLAARLLGREVLRRADDRADLGHLRGAGAGDAEVGDLEPAVGRDDDVVRLDVAVHDAVVVGEAQRREDLRREADRAVRLERRRARRSRPSASGPSRYSIAM